MILKLNKKMKELYDNQNCSSNLNLLQEVVTNSFDFIEIENCILLEKAEPLIKIDIDKILSLYYDRTGYEASYNEFRLEDYAVDISYESEDYIGLCLKFLELFSKKLEYCFPAYNFHIILGYDGTYMTFRFYKIRQDESYWLDIDDLESFENAIAVMII